MTKFTFQVGNTPATMVGQMIWNANGTLNNLAITDGFNAGGTQTCYYNPSSGSGKGYDDLGRLLYVSCGTGGSIWNQTFGYDQYDNLTKSTSGPGVSWNPGYNTSNNHYTLVGTSYDSDGNLTQDPVHVYEWNEFAKMKSVDRSGTNCATSGECIVYDALGRAVEIDKGSTSTEIWYTQLGKTAYMNGSTVNYAYWPAPGGGTELISGSAYYMHKDWLGSARLLSKTNNHVVTEDMAFAPYGEIYDQFGPTLTQYQMFTGDTQDIVSGMMDTPNREYNSAAQGRWLSPDPVGAGWNLYAYSTNPNSYIDPSGLKPVVYQCPDINGCWTVSGAGGGGGSAGNDEFDAIEGMPGTYLTLDMYGNLGFGFSQQLWVIDENFLDQVNASIEVQAANLSAADPGSTLEWNPTPPLTVLVQDFGAETVISGLVPDYLQLLANQLAIESQLSPKEQDYFSAGLVAPSIVQSNNPMAFYMAAWWEAANSYFEETMMTFGVTPVFP